MIPAFAVVGHPNKGKSSVVSTLARDDRVAVSMQSGTTQVSESFDIHLGEAHYKLIDTPGFQRPRKVLAWLQQQPVSADQRSERVKAFLQDEACRQQFPDESELLAPIMAGAAILYVVDSSRPYSPEYEAEMEILRWTGQPSMALINPITSRDYIDNWQQALQQFFRTVRIFDAVQADLNQHIELLQAFAHLHQPWSESLSSLVSAVQAEIHRQQLQSCKLAAHLLEDLVRYQQRQKVPDEKQAKSLQPVLQAAYYSWMRKREQKAHDELQTLYRHHQLQRDNTELTLSDDLFDTEKWYAWGLNRKQLAAVGGIAGAAAGGMLDLTVAGSSLLLGTLGGGAIGSSAAWLGANKLAKQKLKGLPLGGFEARIGPMKNRNFPYVILARFLFIYKRLNQRNHARRDTLSVDDAQVGKLLEQLSGQQQKPIYKALDRLSRQKDVTNLAEVLEPLFTDGQIPD
ncbi:DUF3482 domain-containing protein [Aliamphritea spongicola]|uniref:DUF3482 domain-containing protein n=1 Tax=Aliamphritea spongicola TaxID=707589 RepID=UPI00196B84E3|nr:DUF3482 domain-containing protein [Aliamphritea spongicola]MBN3562205.1 GTPase/DUF3482 domain-containing protein [Aliamphritea spongicola]